MLFRSSGMAAAAAVEMAGGTQDQAATAMAISLKNMLGLVSDHTIMIILVMKVFFV